MDFQAAGWGCWVSSEATTPWAPLLGSRSPQGRQGRLQGIVRGTQVSSVSNRAKGLVCLALPGFLPWRPPHRLWSSSALTLADGLVTGRCFHLPLASRLTELPEEIKCLLFYFVSCRWSLLFTEGVGWLGRSLLWVWRKAAHSSPTVGSRELREPPCPLSLCSMSLAGEEKRLASLEGL